MPSPTPRSLKYDAVVSISRYPTCSASATAAAVALRRDLEDPEAQGRHLARPTIYRQHAGSAGPPVTASAVRLWLVPSAWR